LDAVSAETGRVQVNGRGDGEFLDLSVSDNGHGIPPEARSRIFAPFYTTKDVGAGMGLGLTIVHRVVMSLGGTINVTSNVGVGSTFVLRLPRKQPARTEKAMNALAAAP
jgi:two-component system NtrC family sensor kinase